MMLLRSVCVVCCCVDSRCSRPGHFQINNNGSADDGSVGGSGGVVIPQR